MKSGIFTMLKFKNKLNNYGAKLFLITFVLSLFNFCVAKSDDFDGVTPPPELGETLTNYRTKKQILDEHFQLNIQATPKEEPKIKIIPKNNVADSNHAKKKTIKIRDLKEEELFYMSLKGTKFNIPEGSKLFIEVLDPQGVHWPIQSIDVMNKGFKADIDDNSKRAAITHGSSEGLISKIKVYLFDVKEPLNFVVMKTSNQNHFDELKKITITKKSPWNTSNVEVGVTNMVKTSKARNSRREISENTEVNITNKKLEEEKKKNAVAGPFGKRKVYVVNEKIQEDELLKVMQTLEDAVINAK